MGKGKSRGKSQKRGRGSGIGLRLVKGIARAEKRIIQGKSKTFEFTGTAAQKKSNLAGLNKVLALKKL